MYIPEYVGGVAHPTYFVPPKNAIRLNRFSISRKKSVENLVKPIDYKTFKNWASSR